MARKPPGVAKTPVPHIPYLYLVYQDLNVGLNVNAPINPGDPIVFQWTSWPLNVRPLDLGTVSFSLHLLDPLGNVDPAAVLYHDQLSAADSQKVVNQFFTSRQLAAVPLPDLEKRIYKEGAHGLRLVVSGTGADGPYESPDETLNVVLPAIDDSWWNWTVPDSRIAAWKKEKYLVAGALTNRSAQPASFSATLLETNNSDTQIGEKVVDAPGEHALSTVSSSSPLAAGANLPVTYASVDLSKAWSWFTFGVFVYSGPIAQTYTYRVRLDLSDPYGNAWPPFFTQRVDVMVMVSDIKEAAFATAAGCTAGALVFLAMAAIEAAQPPFGDFAALVLLGIASGLESAALIAGAIAQDPPIPDRRYRVIYEPAAVAVPDDEELQPLVEFARSVCEVIAHVEALGVTDSRIAGARAARAKKSLEQQSAHFEATRKQLPQLAREVRKRLPAAAGLLAERPLKPTPAAADRGLRALAHDGAFRARARQAWLDAGGSSSGFDAAGQILEVPEFSDMILAPESAITPLARFAENLAAVATAASPEG